jgi:hypothetical protein
MIDNGSKMPQLDQKYTGNSSLYNITIAEEDELFSIKKLRSDSPSEDELFAMKN